MAAAIVLTALALVGVLAGIRLGQAKAFSNYLMAASGGMLSGISIFWLLPESAETSSWMAAAAMTAAAFALLLALDRAFLHAHDGFAGIALGPLLAASAVHSFIDGWSVRALLHLRVATVGGSLGLALHKVPEGLALGWIARQKLKRPGPAAAAAIGAELLTLVGALVEPQANRSGFAAFGSWWTSAVVSVISGSFLFFAIHAVAPNRRHAGAILVFLGALAAVAMVSLYRSPRI